MLRFIMLSVMMLSVMMLNVIMLIVFMLNVMAPFAYAGSSNIAMQPQLMRIACQEFVF